MRALRSGFALLCATALLGAARADEPPPAWDEYWAQVESARSPLDAPIPESQAQLLVVAGRLAVITAVQLPGGALLPLDHSFLVAELRADPPDLARLSSLLDALLAARPAQPSTNARADDLAELAAILARPEFRWQPAQPSPFERLLRWLFARLWEISQFLFPDGLDPSVLRTAFVAFGVLALLIVLALVGRSLVRDLVTEAEAALAADTPAEPLTAESAMKQAQLKASSRDYRSAVRYLYLASLLSMEERGLLRYDRSQTNREYVRKVASRPAIAAPLRYVVDVFDRVWYGFQSVDEAEYDRYVEQVADLQRQQ